MTELLQVVPQRKALRLQDGDNVAVALVELHAGEAVSVGWTKVVLAANVHAKHKFALGAIPAGKSVVMYGTAVGEALEPISVGGAISTANVVQPKTAFGARGAAPVWKAPNVEKWRTRTFQGFRRADGQVGTRNHWLVVPLVFCENHNIAILRRAFAKELGESGEDSYARYLGELAKAYRAGGAAGVRQQEFSLGTATSSGTRLFPNVDGVKFLTHEMGCGGTREDARTLCGLIAGYVCHPNVAGATILSLGCQNSEISLLQEEIRKRDDKFAKPLLIFDQQRSEVTSTMLSEAIRETFLGLAQANEAKREAVPLSALNVGLKCGGSDGFSGLSANPTVGHVSDMVVALGGKTILAEFPELCGVEQNLIDRCLRDEDAKRFGELMNAYSARAKAVGSGLESNPSPGNIADGLLTGAMKSAGAARKGGSAPISGVLDYPERATNPGLHLLCTPGNDVEAVTAQVGAGANVVLFTTGLGTPTGNPVAPVMKISTNTALARRMHDIVDFNTGDIVTGDKSVEQMGDALLEEIVRVASGEAHTKAEQNGQDDFIPWKRGVSL
jgi:altronate hydrolase